MRRQPASADFALRQGPCNNARAASLATQMSVRYGSELETSFELSAVLGLIDEYAAEIDASARRDQARWRDAYLGFERWSGREDFTDYEDELDYIRSWVIDRHHILGQRY